MRFSSELLEDIIKVVHTVKRRQGVWDAVPEPWRAVGSGGNPAFENNWVNFGAAVEVVGFYKDRFGRVHLQGSAKDGSVGDRIFTLPEEYRPKKSVLFAVSCYDGSKYVPGIVAVNNLGRVITQSGHNNMFSLDGISFRADD